LIARGKHYLLFGEKTNEHPTLEGRERLLQNRILLPNWLFFDDVSNISYDDWTKKYTNIVSFPFCERGEKDFASSSACCEG
jgi:lysosomal alpha-mannosidase